MSGRRVGASMLGLIVSSAAIATAGELGAVDSVVGSAVGMVSICWVADVVMIVMKTYLHVPRH